jgi:hypothetical protein
MSTGEEFLETLNEVSEGLWNMSFDDAIFKTLKAKCLSLSGQVAVHQSLKRSVSHVLRSESSVPLPNSQARIGKFLDFLYGNGNAANPALESRQQQLQKLDCQTFLLIAVSYTPLEISKMNRIEFDYLIQYAPKYSNAKYMPPQWIFRKEIQLAIAEKSDLANIRLFKKSKYLLFVYF